MKDLFETPDDIPAEVQAVLESFDEEANPYPELERLLKELELLGYTFDYSLNAEPFALRPLNVPLNMVDGYGDDDTPFALFNNEDFADALHDGIAAPKVIGYVDIDNKATVDMVTHTTDAKGDHHFSIDMMISMDKARELQGLLSYHPAGYGFYGFNATIKQTTWSCWNSCD